MTAAVRLNVAIVFLSVTRSALEMAEIERTKTTRAGKNEKMPATPLEVRLRRNVTIPAYNRSNGVGGSTNRCLYLLARTSVAELFETRSAEEKIDDN